MTQLNENDTLAQESHSNTENEEPSNVADYTDGEKRFKEDSSHDPFPNDSEDEQDELPKDAHVHKYPKHYSQSSFKLEYYFIKDTNLDPETKKALENERFQFWRKVFFTDLPRYTFSKPFTEPIENLIESVPEYADYIRHPIDIATVQQKMLTDAYNGNLDWILFDLYVLLDNCFHFNVCGSEVSNSGLKIQKIIIARMVSSKLFTKEQINFLQSTNPQKYENHLSSCRMDTRKQYTKREREVLLAHDLMYDAHPNRSKDHAEDFFPLINTLPSFPMVDADNLFMKLTSLPPKAFEEVKDIIRKYNTFAAVDINWDTLHFCLTDLDPHFLQYLDMYCSYVGSLPTQPRQHTSLT
ncbi:hypothetical protein BLNAU_12886 [Blattamonas nauphoetae]|uniref:Bromo domain-containing protein n=1 Tax=Blattamonas nauphoetae TaxID=2049346 RepID=A0ABQ9XID0_9EUKA|nr:hypothetical protein BLNAU_12886 [Blattamonas nauphoetae]